MIGPIVAPSRSVSCGLLVCFHTKQATRQYMNDPPLVSRMHFCINSLSAVVVFTASRIDQVIKIGYLGKKISYAVQDVPIEEW